MGTADNSELARGPDADSSGTLAGVAAALVIVAGLHFLHPATVSSNCSRG